MVHCIVQHAQRVAWPSPSRTTLAFWTVRWRSRGIHRFMRPARHSLYVQSDESDDVDLRTSSDGEGLFRTDVRDTRLGSVQ